jgi:hypothetical protein
LDFATIVIEPAAVAVLVLSIHRQRRIYYALASLVVVLIFSLILSQALLMSKLLSKLSKAANIFENFTWYFSLSAITVYDCSSNGFAGSNLAWSMDV